MLKDRETLTKKVLVEELVENHHLTKKDAAEIVNNIFDSIGCTLKNGGVVDISGFGKFTVKTVKERKERTGVSPRTGERIKINATKVPSFKASKTLKELVK